MYALDCIRSSGVQYNLCNCFQRLTTILTPPTHTTNACKQQCHVLEYRELANLPPCTRMRHLRSSSSNHASRGLRPVEGESLRPTYDAVKESHTLRLASILDLTSDNIDQKQASSLKDILPRQADALMVTIWATMTRKLISPPQNMKQARRAALP